MRHIKGRLDTAYMFKRVMDKIGDDGRYACSNYWGRVVHIHIYGEDYNIDGYIGLLSLIYI